jgi:hypothetical protein
VWCNAGVQQTKQKGTFGDFPKLVWYDPKGVTNILSLHIMKKYFRVRYDSCEDDTFIVSGRDGEEYHFEPTSNGLYAMVPTMGGPQEWGMAFVMTVKDQMEKYTKCEYEEAKLARQVQNIIMYPGVREYQSILEKNIIRNIPVTCKHVKAAEDIFGPNIGSLKGKTVTRPGERVRGHIGDVPRLLRDKFQSIVLGMDIMFVNGIPFLVMTSRGLQFGTIENLNDRKVPQVSSALHKVIALYK